MGGRYLYCDREGSYPNGCAILILNRVPPSGVSILSIQNLGSGSERPIRIVLNELAGAGNGTQEELDAGLIIYS